MAWLVEVADAPDPEGVAYTDLVVGDGADFEAVPAPPVAPPQPDSTVANNTVSAVLRHL